MKTYRCWAEVDLDALRSNLAGIRHKVGPKISIMTVVKADAYGHGLKQIAALLMQSGTDVFGVANLAEAMAIRSVGQGWPILMLGPCLPDEVPSVVRDRIMPTISTLEEARRFSHAMSRETGVLQVHLKVDTGMGRLGCQPEEAARLAQEIAALPGLRLEGLETHFSSVEDNSIFTKEQQRKFTAVVRQLNRAGLKVPSIHANNSGGVLLEPSSTYSMVRPGLLVYGIVPPGERTRTAQAAGLLRPALTWKCRVGFVREVSRGASVSYGRSFVAPRRMKLATLTAGYGDGFLRSGSNRASVLIGGKRCRVVGRITMDQTVVDVSKVDHVQPGDEAVLIGRQGEESISAMDLAGWCGTIPWEVLTNITYRVPRLYRGGQAA